jgi:hypothetical protein
VRTLQARIAERSKLAAASVVAADFAWLAPVFGLSALALAGGTYNPFIYFRF